jgi:hypothetical protein
VTISLNTVSTARQLIVSFLIFENSWRPNPLDIESTMDQTVASVSIGKGERGGEAAKWQSDEPTVRPTYIDIRPAVEIGVRL